MKCNYRRLLILCLVIFSSRVSFSQSLWPGDINNNGIVNSIDVLYAGIAYGNTGATRPDASSNWQDQLLGPLWTNSFFDAINHAYADCDGNGIVEDDDIKETLKDNFFLIHGAIIPDVYSGGSPDTAPEVKLIPQSPNVDIGATVIFGLWLGDGDFPVQDFYGIAIAMRYNPDFVLGSEWEFEEATNAWYDPTDENSEYLIVADEGSGKMEVAITRTNQLSVSGAGKIGEISIVIEDIILGLQTDTLNLEIESIRMIDKDFNTLSVVKDSTFIVVSRPNATIDLVDESSIHVFPNPTKNSFTISSEVDILGFEVIDLAGRSAFNRKRNQNHGKLTQVSLDAYNLKPQLYFLKIFTKEGLVIKKLLLI